MKTSDEALFQMHKYLVDTAVNKYKDVVNEQDFEDLRQEASLAMIMFFRRKRPRHKSRAHKHRAAELAIRGAVLSRLGENIGVAQRQRRARESMLAAHRGKPCGGEAAKRRQRLWALLEDGRLYLPTMHYGDDPDCVSVEDAAIARIDAEEINRRIKAMPQMSRAALLARLWDGNQTRTAHETGLTRRRLSGIAAVAMQKAAAEDVALI